MSFIFLKVDFLMFVYQVVENGVCYKASLDGQKTGFYADQRDNRFWLQSVAKDKSILDLCCYSGGFALIAAVGGASEVTGNKSFGPCLYSYHLDSCHSFHFFFCLTLRVS